MSRKFAIVVILILSLFNMHVFAQSVPSSSSRVTETARDLSVIIDEVNLDDWRAENYNGNGIRIGILDIRFGDISRFNLADFRDEALLTAQQRGEAFAQSDAANEQHGASVIEIIQTIAPEADIYGCRYTQLSEFQNCVSWMINQDVNIINHSAGAPVLPLDGSSDWAREVDRAAARDILWVNAAGNFARGYQTGSFTRNPDNPLEHWFIVSGQFYDSISLPALTTERGESVSATVLLSWQNPTDALGNISAEANQLDFQIVVRPPTDPQVLAGMSSDCRSEAENAGPEDIIRSTQIQNGGDSGAYDLMVVELGCEREIAIFGPPLPANENSPDVAIGTPFALFVEFADIRGSFAQQSIISPGDSSLSLTVGALQGGTIAPYSSRGPLITGVTKPDMVAPGDVVLQNGTPFVGTSAAAPIVTGAAALIRQAFPEFNRQDVFDYFIDNVVPDVNGVSIIFGNGTLRMPQPPPNIGTPIVAEGREIPLPIYEPFDNARDVIESQWGYEDADGGWTLFSLDGDIVLSGLANIDRDIQVFGRADTEWVSSSQNLLISFNFRLDPGADGIRMIFRESADNGYNVMELQPGAIIFARDDRNDGDTGIDFRDSEERLREKPLLRGTFSAPIQSDIWYNIQLWVVENLIYVYLDDSLVAVVEDQFQPRLRAGRIYFQAMNAQRRVYIDDLVLARALESTTRFSGNSLPSTWSTTNRANTDITDDGLLFFEDETTINTSFPSFDTSIGYDVTSGYDGNLRMQCAIRSSIGNLYLELNDANGGTLNLDFIAGALDMTYVDASGAVIWAPERVENVLTRNLDNIYLSLDENEFEIYRNGRAFVITDVLIDETIRVTDMSFRTENRSEAFLNDCLFMPVIGDEFTIR